MESDTSKRKIFIQRISSQTTKRSLESYFSDYPIHRCAVPMDESTGKNRMHGIVTFRDEKNVDAVMSQRVHIIDGKEVFIHRAVPTQQSAKNSMGITQLIVTIPEDESLSKSDIKEYFSRYGDISNMENDKNTWLIDFDYYDAVDKILVYAPHQIKRIKVDVKKGDQRATDRYQRRPVSPFERHEATTTADVKPKSPTPKKVTMNDHVSCFQLHAKTYCIYITNLLVNIDAGTLSEKFSWDIYNIIMNPSNSNSTSSIECWLKNANNEDEIDSFIREWNGKKIDGSIITCEKREDDIEFCNKFQFGRCEKSADQCNWEHIPCTAEGTCASTCRYGHPLGMKSENDSNKNVATAIPSDYRIKLSGFKNEVTPENLKRFGRHNYYVDRKNDRVGYVVKIRTMKYARHLMNDWHNKTIDGQLIRCQLELNPISSTHDYRARSPSRSVDGRMERRRSRTRPQNARSLRSSQGASDLEDIDNMVSTSTINKEADSGRRIYGRAFNDLSQSSLKSNLSRTNSSENISTENNTSKYHLPSDLPTNEWEITNKASNSDGKVLLIRKTNDRKHLAVIKNYSNHSSSDFAREIYIMKCLKDIKGVSQLIEPVEKSNNLNNRDLNNIDLWMICKRAPGCSLKEFIERKYHGVPDMSIAIPLTLNLIKIIEQIHSKGVFHQNLSPDNIMIEWDSKSAPDHAQLTVLNFNQAMNISNRTFTPIISSTQRWYSAPQIDDRGMCSTMDCSDICAILFWLLTKTCPRHENNKLPHQLNREELDDTISRAVQRTNAKQKRSLEEQLKRYLIDTFDRAFGYPNYHPWTINNLQCRLESILQLLTSNESKLNDIDEILQELASISDTSSTSPQTTINTHWNIFEKASQAFVQAKQHFLNNQRKHHLWFDGHCAWIYNPHTSIKECYNSDILTCQVSSGRKSISYSVIITCWARCSDDERVMTLSVSSDINGRTIEMPIGQYSTAKDYTNDVQENFLKELTNLLLAIYKQRKNE